MSKLLNGWIAAIALALLALGAAGCPALMVPRLAYQGYQYEKTGSLPGVPSSSQSETKSAKKVSPAPTPAPDEIE
jgi:hypothetical protein